MPISSTGKVLTHRIEKPEPKSLLDEDMYALRNQEYGESKAVKVLKSEEDWSRDDDSRRATPEKLSPAGGGSPMLGSLNREKHISGISGRMVFI